jgi:hypothetical protein
LYLKTKRKSTLKTIPALTHTLNPDAAGNAFFPSAKLIQAKTSSTNTNFQDQVATKDAEIKTSQGLRHLAGSRL